MTMRHAVDIGSHNTRSGVNTRTGVAQSRPGFHRWPIGRTDDTKCAPCRLGNHVKTLVSTIGTISAKSFDRGIDDHRVDFFQNLVSQIETFHNPR